MAMWVSLEGVEGVGKSYLAPRLAARFGSGCTLVDEVTDAASTGLVGRVIEALSSSGDLFLRTGHPLTETFALLAVKAHERERVSSFGGDVLLEDRGPDTVAIYQAIILSGGGEPAEAYRLVRRIRSVAERWHPLPGLTLLLVDDIGACLERFSARIGRNPYPDEVDLVERADQLYDRLARDEPGRVTVIDRRGHRHEETVEHMYRACAARVRSLNEETGP